MDYTKLIESLKGLIRDDSSPEQVEQITNIVRDVEAAKTENDDLIINYYQSIVKFIKKAFISKASVIFCIFIKKIIGNYFICNCLQIFYRMQPSRSTFTPFFTANNTTAQSLAT